MLKFFTILYFVLSISVVNAQKDFEKQDVKNVIGVFFEGLHEGDSTKVSKTLHRNVKIQTTYTNKEGKHVLKEQTREEILKAIFSKNKKDTYFEKLVSYDIKIDDNLAVVWTPYEFYLNNKLSHCGTNSFHLFNDDGKWKIIYLIDTRRRKKCKIN